MPIALIEKVQKEYLERFNSKPIIIISPGRINLIGEHTDYNEGFVLPAAIDRYIVCAVGKNKSDNLCHVEAMDMAAEFKFSLNSIKPKADKSWENYLLGIIAEIQSSGKIISGFNMVIRGNIPIGSGLSSSAALENSIIYGLNKIFGLSYTKIEMIEISQAAEHKYVGVQCGIMDQFSSMFGDHESLLLLDCRSLEYELIKTSFVNYELLLIDSNVKHTLSSSEYNTRKRECEKGVDYLKNFYPIIKSLRDVNMDELLKVQSSLPGPIYNRCKYVINENIRVLETVQAIKENNVTQIGELLYQSHLGLKDLYEVSCAELDYLVQRGKESSVIVGSRLMGGGFGGCTINLIQIGMTNQFIYSIADDYKRKFNKELNYYDIRLTTGTRQFIS